jgi:curved DNA-binding protein
MAQKNYYQILGIDKNASADEIKKAYRRLAMQCHPDRNHGNEEWAHDKFKEINEAFSILGDPDKRSQYDQFGTVGKIEDIFSSQYTHTTFDDIISDFGGESIGFDFLDNVFGDNLGGRNFAFRRFRRGHNKYGRTRFEQQTGIDLEDLFTNAQPLEASEVIFEIAVSQEQAAKGMEKELVRGGKRLKVKIPAGVKTGSRIRLRNALVTTDGQAGDIIIKIEIK